MPLMDHEYRQIEACFSMMGKTSMSVEEFMAFIHHWVYQPSWEGVSMSINNGEEVEVDEEESD